MSCLTRLYSVVKNLKHTDTVRSPVCDKCRVSLRPVSLNSLVLWLACQRSAQNGSTLYTKKSAGLQSAFVAHHQESGVPNGLLSVNICSGGLPYPQSVLSEMSPLTWWMFYSFFFKEGERSFWVQENASYNFRKGTEQQLTNSENGQK